MWFQKKHKRAIPRCRRLYFDQLEERELLSISYPLDVSAVTVDNGILSATFIPVDNLTINSGATVDLTPFFLNPQEPLGIKNTINNGLLNISCGNKTIGSVNGSGDIIVSDGSTLTVSSINQKTLTIGAGSKVTLAPIPGGPLDQYLQSDTYEDIQLDATMDGGTLTYNSDALPNLAAEHGATLICTDPPDVNNAWRSTETIVGGEVEFPLATDDGIIIDRNTDPSTWPPLDQNQIDTLTNQQTTTYYNRFHQPIALEQDFSEQKLNGEILQKNTLMAHDYTSNILYGEHQVESIVTTPTELVVTPTTIPAEIPAVDALIAQANQQMDDFFNSSVPEATDPSSEGYRVTAKVVHGTPPWSQVGAILTGESPTGEWGQPAGYAEGGWHYDPMTGISFNVMIYGSNDEVSCNTLVPDKDGDQHGGTVKVGAAGMWPGQTWTIRVEVYVYLILTDYDPRVGTPTCPADAIASAEIIPYIGEENREPTPSVSAGPKNPGNFGKIISGTLNREARIVVGADGTQKIVKVQPSMRNSGSGLICFGGGIRVWAWPLVDQPVVHLESQPLSTHNLKLVAPDTTSSNISNIMPIIFATTDHWAEDNVVRESMIFPVETKSSIPIEKNLIKPIDGQLVNMVISIRHDSIKSEDVGQIEMLEDIDYNFIESEF